MRARLPLLLLLPLAVPPRSDAQCSATVPTRVITVWNQHLVAPHMGFSGSATNVGGCHFINVYVQYRDSATSAPQPGGTPSVSLGLVFMLDARQDMQSRMYVNLESNVTSIQNVNLIDVAPKGPFTSTVGTETLGDHGSYIVRIPVMGPWVTVVPFNDAGVSRYVSVKIYAQY